MTPKRYFEINWPLDPLKNVDIYYENWRKTATSDENLVFQKLWELVMIRRTTVCCDDNQSFLRKYTFAIKIKVKIVK